MWKEIEEAKQWNIKMNDELSTKKHAYKKWNTLAKHYGSEKYYAEHKVK